MIKSLRILMTALLLVTGVIISEAQRIVGYLPSYRDVNLSTIRYSCVTDIYFSFINFDANGNLITANTDATFGFDMTKFSAVKTKCKPQVASGPNLWISVGGADNPGLRKARFATVCGNTTARANLVSQLINFANTHGLKGIDIDWEFPDNTTTAKNNHQSFMSELRTAVNTYNTNNPTKALKISMAVGGETNPALSSNSGHLAYCNAATIGFVDYLHVMSYDLPSSYGNDHTDVARSQEAMNNWQAFGGNTNAPWSKMTIGIAFYGRNNTRTAELEYNNLGAADAATVFNSTTGGQGAGYWFDSKKDCEDKIDWIMAKGGSGVIIWDIGQDRNDYNLQDAICAKMASACAAPQPNLGTDKGVCMPGTISLNSNVTTASGRTFSWKENGVTISGTSPTLSKSTSGMAAGTYEYEVTVTQSSCSRTSKVKVVLSNPVAATGATICGTGTATLNVTSTGGTYEWYDAATAGNKLHTGSSFTTPSISTNTSYWVQEATGSSTSYIGKTQVEGISNPPGWAITGPADNGGRPNYAQKITLTQSATIEKVTIFGTALPYNNAKVIVYSGSDGAAIIAQSAAANITSSPFNFPVNITLPSGTYFVGILVPGLTDWTGPTVDIKGTQGTFSIPGVMTLSNTCFNGNYVGSGAEQTGYYGQLYNWVVTTGVVNPCSRTQVTATVNPAANQGLAVTATTPICSGVDGTITIASSESGISYQAYKGATAVGTAVTGNGSNITLSIPSASLASGANAITVRATKTGCGTVTLTNSATITVNSATAPTITFANVNKVYGDANFNLSATSPSAGAYTYSVVSGTGANVSTAGAVTITGAGTLTVKVDQAPNGCYLAGSATATLTIAKANRTVTITSPNSGQVGTTVNLTNTTTPAGGTATWSVTPGTGSASVSGTTLTLNTAGTVTVKVDIAADANYNAASATQAFTINPGTSPSIVFNDITKVYGDPQFNLSATSNSAGAFTYSVVSGTAASVSSAGLVTINGAGTVTIKVDQVADGIYSAGSKTITLTINKANRTVTITSSNSGQVGTTVNLTHTATPTGGTATWSVTPGTGSASVSGTTLTLSTAGTVTVKVDIAADANYNAASATQTFTINPGASPTITFDNVTKTYGDPQFNLSATSNSAGAFTYSVVSGTAASVNSAGLVTINGAGTVTIKVDQAADGTYSAGSKTMVLTINKANRTVTITSSNSGQVATTVTLTHTTTPTGGTATWSVTPGTGSASVSGTTLTLSASGTVTVKVDIAADANYNAASSTQTFTINPGATPAIVFNDITKVYGDPQFNLAATSNSPGALTYTLVSGSIATVSTAGLVTITGVGTATIKVEQAPDGAFAGGSKTITLTVNKGTRIVSITSVSNGPVGTTVNLTHVTNPTGGTATWSVTPGTGAATVSGTTLNLTAAGTVSVKVDIAADANYNAASATQTFTIGTGSAPTITFSNITKTYGDPQFNLSATSNSAGAFTYSVVSGTAASVSTAGLVTINGAGTVTIKVDQVADGTYSAGSATATLTINKANRTITITSPSNGPVGTTVTLAGTVSPSGGTIVWSVSNMSGSATVSGITMNLVAPGTVTVRADIAGDANYNASFATQTFTIGTGSSPSIVFSNITKTYGDAAFNLSATSNSGGAFTYSVVSGTGASVTSAGLVTITGAGTVTIKVDQVANGTYSAGSATATLTINKATRTITITSASSGQVGTTVTLTNTVTPAGGTAVWSVTNGSGNATITGTTLNLVAAGTIEVKVDIAGDANYNAASATQTFTINAGNGPTITFNNVTKTYGDAAFSMTATSNSPGAMTYSLVSGTGATISSSGFVTITGAGSIVVKVDQLANGTFAAGSATATLTINKATRTVTITSASSGQVGTTVSLTSNTTPAGGAATWSVTPVTGSASVSGTTLTLSTAGTVTVKVDIAADANYNAASATQTFTINPGTSPTITFNNIFKVFGNAPFTLTSTSNSSGAKTYSVVNSVPAGIVNVTSSGQVTILGAGTVTIKLDQAASGAFGAGSATATLTIAKANRTVTITSGNSGDAGTTVNLTSSVSAGTGAAIWTVTNNVGTASVTGSSLALTSAGLVTVKVTIEADANYNSVSATQLFTINPPSDTPNPGTITGPVSVSKGNTYVYCVTNVPGTTYTWSYNGAGVSMVNNGSNCITISFSNFATPGTLSVIADKDGSGPLTPSSPSTISISVNGVTGVVQELEGVTLEAYPNPFEFTSRIEFTLNSGASVDLSVYNMLGYKMKTILEGETLGAGSHGYELSELPNGIYIVRMKIGNKEKNIKVIKH